jgi:hypothetical protein
MNALLEMVQASIASTPRVLLLGARENDVLSVSVDHEDLLGLIAADLPRLDPTLVRAVARTGRVLVKPAAGAPRLAALAAATSDGELLLHAEDQQGLALLAPLLTKLITKPTGAPLHVRSPEAALVPVLQANGFRRDHAGRMVLGR